MRLGCQILTKELLGLGNLSVPHLHLVRGQEVHHTLANLVPMAGDLFGDVGLCDVWMVFEIVAHLGASICKGVLQLFFLIATEVKVGGKFPCFSNDLITLFLCKVHSNPPVVDRLLRAPPPRQLIVFRVRQWRVKLTDERHFREGRASLRCCRAANLLDGGP